MALSVPKKSRGGAPNPTKGVLPAAGNSRTATARPVASWTIPGLVWPTVPEPDGAELLAIYFQLNKSQWWSPEQIHALQFEQLHALLSHALRNVPFYRERLPAAGFDPARPLTADIWQRLPILTRRDVQEAGHQLHSTQPPTTHGALTKVTTSGATGTPVTVQKSELVQKFFEAATLREALWHGRDFSGKFAVIRPNQSKWLDGKSSAEFDSWGVPYSRLFGTGPCVQFDIFADAAQQVQWLIDEAPDYLLSMPSNLRMLADYIAAHKIQVPPIREIRSYAEAYDDDFPRLCRATWQAKHTSVYSTQEIGIIASQCPKRPHFHVDAELTLVEVVDNEGRPCRPGELGRVIATPLHNFAMPLIRYEVGDLAEVGEPCSCGRGLPVLERVLGRTTGVLHLPSGKKRFMWPLSSGFGQYAAIVQRQVVQRTLVDIDVLLVVREPLRADVEVSLLDRLKQKIGAEFNFRIVYVDSLPRNREGKYEDFRCEIA